MQKILRYIGIVLIIISLGLGIFAVYNKYTTDELAVELLNETGSCYIGETCLHNQSNINFTVILGSAVILLFIGLGMISLDYIRNKTSVKVTSTHIEEKKIKIHYNKPKNLGPESKKIYEIISESGGSVLQGELVSKSGINKVKVSRLLDRMEMQGIVERRRHGMSNIVVLKSNNS